MNILFLLRSVGFGGVEVVSVVLANMLEKKGHKVSIFAREFREKNISSRLSANIHVYYGCGDNGCKKNIALLHDVYEKEKIQLVVNQWGLPYMPIRLAMQAQGSHSVKIISFYHNDPAINGKLNSVNLKLKNESNLVKKIFLEAKKHIYYAITSFSMKYTYNHSDRFMVLSECYLENLQNFIRVSYEKKQGVLTNPITVDNGNFSYCPSDKKKEVIFCGRLDNIQKCPIRVLDVWNILSQKHHQWNLRFVGDGPDKENLEENVRKRWLKNVYFEGFQNPVEYYKRASILVMTSDFEGFPLVLAECMSFGVIPCVYNSFGAVHDIIKDDQNGMIVEKINGFFSAKEMASRLAEIMSDDCRRESMARNAIETSRKYSINSIYKQWEIVLKEI